jgi:hypothetical protein
MLIDAAAAMAANSHTVIGNKDAAHATDYSTIMTGTKVDAECVPSFTIDAADALDLSHHNDTYLSNDDSNVNCHHQEVNPTHSVDSEDIPMSFFYAKHGNTQHGADAYIV